MQVSSAPLWAPYRAAIVVCWPVNFSGLFSIRLYTLFTTLIFWFSFDGLCNRFCNVKHVRCLLAAGGFKILSARRGDCGTKPWCRCTFETVLILVVFFSFAAGESPRISAPLNSEYIFLTFLQLFIFQTFNVRSFPMQHCCIFIYLVLKHLNHHSFF